MNCVVLVGNLANDPESRITQSGIAQCTFRIAVQRRFTNQQGVREADFLPCVAWRHTAEFVAKNFSKGSKIALQGSIQTRSYDAQDGSKRYITEIIVDNAEFASSRSDSQQSAPAARQPAQQPYQQPYNEQMNMGQIPNADDVDDDDELPF